MAGYGLVVRKFGGNIFCGFTEDKSRFWFTKVEIFAYGLIKRV